MNRSFNALLAAYSLAYFGCFVIVLLFPQYFPIGGNSEYDYGLGEVFTKYGDHYSGLYSFEYGAVYYLNVFIILSGVILLAVRKSMGIWFLCASLFLDVTLYFFLNSNTVVVAHKFLTISGFITYPVLGAILALYFSGREKLGFVKTPQLEPLK